jgi:hypothetical protein
VRKVESLMKKHSKGTACGFRSRNSPFHITYFKLKTKPITVLTSLFPRPHFVNSVFVIFSRLYLLPVGIVCSSIFIRNHCGGLGIDGRIIWIFREWMWGYGLDLGGSG